jgi:hypothetical protein
VFVFPAFGLMGLRSGGPKRLRVVTVVALGLVLVFALIVSAGGAHRPASAYGDADTIPRAVLLYGLTLGLPVLSAAGAVRVLGGRVGAFLWSYAGSVIAAGFGWVAGVVLATWLLPLT